MSPVHTGPPVNIKPVTTGSGSTLPPSKTSGNGVTGVITIVISEDDMYFERTITVPSSQWHFVHNLGRVPGVSLYDTDNNEIFTDVNADETTVTATWPGPTTGKLVCS